MGEELTALAWDGRTALVGGGSGDLRIWDLYRGSEVLRIPAHQGPVTTLAVSGCGDEFRPTFVTGGEDRKVVVWTNKKEESVLM